MAYLTPDIIRHYIEDRSPEDNELDMDLSFSDDEIVTAMGHAARDYNSIPPLIGYVEPNQLEDTTMLFIDGTLKHLYIARRARLMRNEIDHSAGGVQLNADKRRIEYFTQLIRDHDASFKQAAIDLKSTINLRAGFGPI